MDINKENMDDLAGMKGEENPQNVMSFLVGIKPTNADMDDTTKKIKKKALQIGSQCQQVLEWQCSVFSWSLAEEKCEK